MDHKVRQERVSMYLDGMLDDGESANIFAHLADCGDCRSFLKLSMQVRQHVLEQDLADIPPSLDERVFTSYRENMKVTKRTTWYTPLWFTRISVPLPAAASIVFLIIVGSLLLSPLLSGDQKQEIEIPKPLVEKIPPGLRHVLDSSR